MRAPVLEGEGVSLQLERLTPRPNEGEALVRVVRAGICDTDLQLVDGSMDFTGVPGHGFVGIAGRCSLPDSGTAHDQTSRPCGRQPSFATSRMLTKDRLRDSVM